MQFSKRNLQLAAADGRLVAEEDAEWEEPIWFNHFVQLRTLPDNVFSIARPLFGKVWAEWAWVLALDVVEQVPKADRGRQKRGWAAGILWAVAVRRGMQRDDDLWDEVTDDICGLTAASCATAQRRFNDLCNLELDRPKQEAPWFRDL